MSTPASRYAVVSRRALLRRGAGLSAVVLLPGLACGNDDSVLLGARTTTVDSIAQVPTTAPLGAPATVPPTAVPPTSEAQAPTEVPPTATGPAPTAVPPTEVPPTAVAPTAVPAAPAPAATALVTGTHATIDFTYTQAEGGKNLPPYVAVWLENSAGELAATVALWFQQRGGERWLPDLQRWYSVDQARVSSGGQAQVDVISSATRLPGAFSVAWDGTTSDGQPAAAGDYFVCIESARERGPYSLIREPVTLAAMSMVVTLGADGELSGAAVTTSA